MSCFTDTMRMMPQGKGDLARHIGSLDMPPNAAMAREQPATRWFRRMAPVLVLLVLLVAALTPGIIMELADQGESTGRGAVAHIDMPGGQPATFDAAQKEDAAQK